MTRRLKPRPVCDRLTAKRTHRLTTFGTNFPEGTGVYDIIRCFVRNVIRTGTNLAGPYDLIGELKSYIDNSGDQPVFPNSTGPSKGVHAEAALLGQFATTIGPCESYRVRQENS